VPAIIGPAAYLPDGGAADTGTFDIGPSAVDTVGGWLPDADMLSPFDAANPVLSWIDPPLLKAVQDAARAAAGDYAENGRRAAQDRRDDVMPNTYISAAPQRRE